VRALIVGAGAVGRYFAARLRLGGHDAVLLARPDGVRALKDEGITLHAGAQEWGVEVSAASETGDPALSEPFDLVIIAVKAYSTADAIGTLQKIRACSEAAILCAQNGIGNEELLAAAFDANRIVAGALTVAVERSGSSIIATTTGGLTLAPMGTTAHNWMLAAFGSTGLPVQAVADWHALKWSKLCLNLIANGVCAVLDWTPAQVYADADAYFVERASLVEAIHAMQALALRPVGLIGYPVGLLVAAVRTLSPALLRVVLANRVVRARGAKLPSLLVDLRARRPITEAAWMYGAVAAAARERGGAPANAALARIVSGIAAGTIDWAEFRGRSQALRRAIEDGAAQRGAG